MSRYLGSITKKSRRYNFSLLENENEFSGGKKRRYAPGQHGNRRIKLSGYGEQLQEKQKMMYLYGLNDRQFRRTFKIAKHMKGALTLNLFIVLESRLDNLVFRMGFAPTRRAARQLVNHGHITVNGRKVDIPSFLVKAGDVITVKTRSVSFMKSVAEMIDMACAPAWMTIDKEAQKITFDRIPEREELDPEIKEQLVIEYYSK